MKKHTVILLVIVVLASVAACLHEGDNPVALSAISSGALLVDTGFTVGSEDIYYPNENLGEYPAFTIRWAEVEDAAFYQIRASVLPITPENWNSAIVMGTIQAPADSGSLFVKVEVQTEPCISCGLCTQICPMSAITVQGGVAVIDYDRCTSCGQCMDVCPVDAITGTRTGMNYYFGIRAFYSEDNPVMEAAVSDDSYRLIYFNARESLFGPLTKNCGLCVTQTDSLNCWGGCHIIQAYADSGSQIFTGFGCPSDAIWQDTLPVGPRRYMVYIDYDKCISCGVCFMECWNYNYSFSPSFYGSEGGYQGLKSVMHKVVPSGWVSNQPLRPLE